MTDPNSFQLYVDYPLPEWSSKPINKYYLEVIKSGIILEEKPIDKKEFYLLGKLPDLSDILLEHLSISRKHAVIQHKSTGEVFIYDLNSTHGTYVNNKKIETKTFHKLIPGDLLKFGASTRFYVLRCPDLETDEKDAKIVTDMGLIKKRIKEEKVKEKPENTVKQTYLKLLENEDIGYRQKPVQKIQEVDGVNWGISDEAIIYNYEAEHEMKIEPSVLRKIPNLTAKQIEKIDQYETKLIKYEQLDNELENICKKERVEFGLDEASKIKKENLEKKIQEASIQLESLEAVVKLVIFNEKIEKRKFEKIKEEDSYMDDDYFDRTNKTAKISDESHPKPVTTENFQSLKEKLENLLMQRDETNNQFLNFEEKEQENQDQDDELEKFMLQNQLNLHKETRKTLFENLKHIEKEIEETQKLLRIVKPNLINENNQIRVFKKDEKSEKKEINKPIIFQKPKPKISQTLENLRKIAEKHELNDIPALEIEEEEIKEEKLENNQEIKPTKKIYSVPLKPPSRNIKEKDIEKKGIENIEWVPPNSQSGDGKIGLNKKLGY